MTVTGADGWAEALRRDSEAGVFFGASNYYGYVAKAACMIRIFASSWPGLSRTSRPSLHDFEN
jgi:hypothetical protein